MTYYLPYAPERMVYMLQRVEYRGGALLRWLGTVPSLKTITYRGSLHMTPKAKALLVLAYGSYLLGIMITTALAILVSSWWLLLGVALPLLSIVVLLVAVYAGSLMLLVTRRNVMAQASRQFAEHPGIKIAVLGSYGKTTMKELLATVLAERKRVAATPGNMNVPLSHARWAVTRLDGHEEVIILEYGEGEPGDIAQFAELTAPQYAVLTGLAPNHLDRYADYKALQDDLRTITRYVDAAHLYCYGQAALAMNLTDAVVYDVSRVGLTDIHDVTVGIEGVSFTMMLDKTAVRLQSKLLGQHQVGPLAAVAKIAHELGLSLDQIKAGIAKTQAFEHRMQPRELHGAWIIDDTYNGNLEGIRAGLELLATLSARRKIYVTPGLVDQGVETERVHREIGVLIAAANPDHVVLMQNSVTAYMQAGLTEAGYEGSITVETRPKEFYEHIEQHVAAGELYMLQNDWPDEYQ